MVSLTSLLVLVSLFSQTNNNIPRTSYMKLVDRWFMAVIVLDFCVIFITVVIEHFRLKAKLESEQVKSAHKTVQVKPKTTFSSPKASTVQEKGNDAKNKRIAVLINEVSKFGFPFVYFIAVFVFSYYAASNIMSDEYWIWL